MLVDEGRCSSFFVPAQRFPRQEDSKWPKFGMKSGLDLTGKHILGYWHRTIHQYYICNPSLALYDIYSPFIKRELEPFMFEKAGRVTLWSVSRSDTPFLPSVWSQDLYPSLETGCLGCSCLKFVMP